MAQAQHLVSDEPSMAGWARGLERSALQEMLVKASRPDIISFALGLPAMELFPKDDLREAAAQILNTDERALQYGPPSQVLKQHIVKLMAERGVTCNQDQVFLTAGAQQGMNMLTRLLGEPGCQVITEQLTYTGFQQILLPLQPQILTVPTDLDTGMDVDAVESLLINGARPAFIYTVTDGHNPVGVSMSAEKRLRLVELARRYRVPIIEDDAYGFLRYGEAVAPLRALDDQWVLYVGSFSKILAPALRVGWAVVNEKLIHNLSIVKEASDIDTATFSQRVVAAYLDSGKLEDHLLRLRTEYRTRRDAMLQALEEHFPAWARWRKPANGIFIWVELAREINAVELMQAAIEQERVAFIPGQPFCVAGDCKADNCLRLNFSNSSPTRIQEGMKRLAQVLKTASEDDF